MTIDFSESISDPTAIDVGNITTQGALVSKTINFPLFTTNENAVWGANIQLQKESYPFAIFTAPVNRNVFKLEVGDTFKFSYAKYGIVEKIYRVLSKNEQSLNSEIITLVAMEDIYAITTVLATYVDPEDNASGSPISSDVTALSHIKIQEAPYIFGDSISLIPIAAKENGLDAGFDFYISIDDGASYLLAGKLKNLVPYGTLVDAYSLDTYPIDMDGFQIDMASGAADIDSITMETNISGTINLAIIDDEIISFQNITPISDTIYEFSGVIRGRYGTTQATHAADSDLFVIQSEMIKTVENSEIISQVNRKFKLVPYNFKYSGDISEAVVNDITISGISKTPYKVINFACNGVSYAARYTDDIVLTWSARKRGSGAGIGTPGIILADTAHEGVFDIKVYVASILIRTQVDIDALTWTYTDTMNLTDNGTLADAIEFRITNHRDESEITYTNEETILIVKQML